MRPTTASARDDFDADNLTVFASPPAVTFSGGTATAYATLDSGGHISGIVVTNPGSYTAPPVALIAGSLATFSVATSANGRRTD